MSNLQNTNINEEYLDIAATFNPSVLKPIDARFLLSKQEMRTEEFSDGTPIALPDIYFCLCSDKDDDGNILIYIYDTNNEINAETGKFRPFINAGDAIDLINQEKAERISADSTITNDLNQRVLAIYTAIQNEANLRTTADNTLQTNINNEILNRDIAITSAINDLIYKLTHDGSQSIIVKNAETATKDSDGNVITDTYATKQNLNDAKQEAKDYIDEEVAEEEERARYEEWELDNKISVIQNDYLKSSDKQELQDSIDNLGLNIDDINSKIPDDASDINKLASLETVKLLAQNNNMRFIGTFNTYADLLEFEDPKENNYATVLNDENHNGDTWRYIYVNEASVKYWKQDCEIFASLIIDVNSLPIEPKSNVIYRLLDSAETYYYVYKNNDWFKFQKNIDDENRLDYAFVDLSEDLLITSPVGEITQSMITERGGAYTIYAGTNLKEMFNEMFSKENQPAITANPYVTLTVPNAGTYEVGTIKEANFTITFNPGSYTYGPETGVTQTSDGYTITCTGKSNITGYTGTYSGTFGNVTAGDSAINITVKTSYNDATAIAVTNKGNPSNPEIKINAGTTAVQTKKINGYRASFSYAGTNLNTLDASWIRSTAHNEGNITIPTTNAFSLTVPEGSKRIVFAIPKSNYELKEAIDVGGMGLDIKDSFNKVQLNVPGLNNYDATAYSVFVFENVNGISATTIQFKVKTI